MVCIVYIVYLDNFYHKAEWERESGEDEDDADDNQHYYKLLFNNG